jgi:O-antigen ligase
VNRATLYTASAIFLFCLLIGGGSSRDDVPALVLVRLAALALAAVLLLRHRPGELRDGGAPLLLGAILVGIMLLQLVPLPPSLWLALPGREFYAEAAAVGQFAQPWRPISLSPDLTIEALLGLLPALAALLLLGLSPPAMRRNAAICLIWITLISVLLAVLQQSGGPDSDLRFYHYTNQDSGVGLLANRNHQALLMAMGIPAATWWASRPGPVIQSAPVRLAIGASLVFVCLVGSVLTGSRAGLLLCAIALLAAVAIAWPLLRAWPRPVRWSALGFFLVSGALAAMLLLPRQRLSTALFLSDPRSEFWPRAVDMIREFFPVGAGFGTFERVYPRFEQIADVTPEYLNKAHNDLLELGVEAGVLGYALLLLFLGWWLLNSLRVWRARGVFPDLLLGRLGSVLICLGLLASLTDYPLRTPLLGTIFAGACVLLAKANAALKERAAARMDDAKVPG